MKPRPQALRNRAQLSKFTWRNQDPARAAPGHATGLACAVRIVVAVVVASCAQRNGAAADGAAVDPPAAWAEQRRRIKMS